MAPEDIYFLISRNMSVNTTKGLLLPVYNKEFHWPLSLLCELYVNKVLEKFINTW